MSIGDPGTGPPLTLPIIAIVLGTVFFLYVSFIPEKFGHDAAPDGSGLKKKPVCDKRPLP